MSEQPTFLKKLTTRPHSVGWETPCPDKHASNGFAVLIRPDEKAGRYRFECLESVEGDLCHHEGQLFRLLGFTEAEISMNGAAPAPLRTRGVILERVRPLKWLWARRIPMGLPSLIVGEEGVGKGTLTAWLIARATRGELEGDLEGEPVRVLVIGDEDGFEPIWVPRLEAAGADLELVRTLDDGEYLEDLRASALSLSRTVKDEAIGLLLFDQILDHVWGGTDGQAIYNPKNVREALMPVRRVAGEHGIAAISLLHPIKGNVSSFRQLISGSHQFNAVSRSSLLLGVDPDDEARRVLVRGKGNHSAMPRSFEFTLAAELVSLNGHTFEVPKVVNEQEGDRTTRDLLNAIPASPVRDKLAAQLEPLLTHEEQPQKDLAKAVGRGPQDGSVRNALAWLESEGRAENPSRGKWTLPGEVQVQPLKRIALSTPSAPPAEGTPSQDELDLRDRGWASSGGEAS